MRNAQTIRPVAVLADRALRFKTISDREIVMVAPLAVDSR